MAAPDWRAKLAFSDRLSTVTKISSALQDSNPSVTAADARKEAASLETKRYETCASLEEYQKTCREQLEELLRKAVLSATSETEPESLPSPTGLNIGKYTNAIYHGEGLFSIVHKAKAQPDSLQPPSTSEIPPANSVVALKLTTPSAMQPPHDSRREARILQLSTSNHVMPLLESFRDDDLHFILVFPFMPHDLGQLLQDQLLSKGQIKRCLEDMFSALAFIHCRNIIHRDVKPSNIMVKSLDGPAYLSDFGIAWAPADPGSEPEDSKITDVGTTCYRPPELLFGNSRYGCSLDLWAAGCAVAEAVVPGHPTLFDSGELGSDLALIQSIFTKLGTPNLAIWPEAANFPDWGKMLFKEYPPEEWSSLLPGSSRTECDLVSSLVRYESGTRTTAAQALEHSYFSHQST